jgi:type I restriction enzyme S subunit
MVVTPTPKRDLLRDLSAGGAVVAFGDVVENVTASVRDPAAAGLARYVGLDHLDPASLRLRRWGSTADGTTFTRKFCAGDVLFAKRRAYQRKAAVAPFDGVCSGDLLVFRATGLHPELLPFLVQTDSFVEHALATSAGSLSPRTKWKDLATFSFRLPDAQRQERIVRVFQQLEAALARYELAFDQALTVEQTLVDRLFEPPEGGGSIQLTTLGDVCSKIVDGVHKRPSYVESGIPFLTVENLTRTRGIDFDVTRFVSEDDHMEFIKRTHPERGDVLVSKDGTLGVARLVETDRPFSVFVSVAVLKPDPSQLDGRFLRAYFATSTFKQHLRRRVAGSALQHIHLVDCRSAPIPRRALEDQREIATEVETAERALDALEAQLASLKALKQGLLAKLLESPR